MNGSGESFLTHSTDNRSDIGFSFPERKELVRWRKEKSFPYICTSHDRSCEQNGQGKASVNASIRFCLGGGFRFDLRLPILEEKKYRINKRRRRFRFFSPLSL